MSVYGAPAGLALAILTLTGCTQFSNPFAIGPMRATTPTEADAADHGSRRNVNVLEAFADRHDLEAEVMWRQESLPSVELMQQRRTLARELRTAAKQIQLMDQLPAACRSWCDEPAIRDAQDGTVELAWGKDLTRFRSDPAASVESPERDATIPDVELLIAEVEGPQMELGMTRQTGTLFGIGLEKIAPPRERLN